MFYLIQDEELKLYSDDKEILLTTLEFTPQFKEERVLETDIITEDELRAHPNKVIVNDIEIEIDVPDYETVTKEIETPVYKDVEQEELDEDGNVIGTYFIKEIDYIETKTIEEEVQVDSHKEVIVVKGLVLNPNYEKEEKEKERERLDSLTLTPSDVERALYKAKGMDFDDLKALIVQTLPTVDLKALSIEFRAKDFWRGATFGEDKTRLFDVVGALLGYTPEDMDYLFENKELPQKEEDESNTDIDE